MRSLVDCLLSFAETEECLNACQLLDMGFTGSMYIWWNGGSHEACISKRPDRCLGNRVVMYMFPSLEVEKLINKDPTMHLSQ